ncbi:Bromodomain containing protein [Trichomonas vaginalis G3]|uniref:Bromodomain containing protein n=1 Tax=Trichomonas vaginalis (strain ATCC PRA-98 / G3) TaxID=412133 RepID=A2EKP3_TRIV3|nr:acetylation-dependent protein binding [Trichomonas vaginalis G3]EAY06782.1 Bromodomain containing protein [Trichomonas vaginalis G3]KAI5485857.1 acetylation-dependent protein binding [Trichomonas vaginalis G3]|eukprot:XP_001319005.1 Bromodomain containing protein [Trichomonas vaginalis G3]
MSTGTYDHEWCSKTLGELMKWPLTTKFRAPVDPIKDGAPNYLEIVKNPIDLSTIKKKLHSNEYKTAKDFVDDVKLIYENAKLFNGENSMITFMACDIATLTQKQYEQKPNSHDEELKIKLETAVTQLNEHLANRPPELNRSGHSTENIPHDDDQNKINDDEDQNQQNDEAATESMETADESQHAEDSE